MAQVLIRNLEKKIVDRLKALALEHGRSLQAEVKRILEEQIRYRGVRSLVEFRRRADEIRKQTNPAIQTDSTDMVREDRDR